MLHEILHTLGVVATCAPNHTLSGHVSDDPRDLMYAGPLPWQPSSSTLGEMTTSTTAIRAARISRTAHTSRGFFLSQPSSRRASTN